MKLSLMLGAFDAYLLRFALTINTVLFALLIASVRCTGGDGSSSSGSDGSGYNEHTVTDASKYIQHNLHDYCSDDNWTDFPGKQMISAEKSVLIKNPLIVNFNHNTSRKFASYCLLRLITREGSRIYATGSSTGISTNSKIWFTESLHFTPTQTKRVLLLKVREVFETTTHSNALELVFEQLERQQFTFQLVVTPFRDKVNQTECEENFEYQCNNNRCIEEYLQCDHRNNCGDFSDESDNCIKNLPVFTTDIATKISSSSATSSSSTPKHVVDQTIQSTTDFSFTTNKSSSQILFDTQKLKTSFTFFDIFIYIIVVLSIIIVVTTVNFLIWCLITKTDQSFLVLARN